MKIQLTIILILSAIIGFAPVVSADDGSLIIDGGTGGGHGDVVIVIPDNGNGEMILPGPFTSDDGNSCSYMLGTSGDLTVLGGNLCMTNYLIRHLQVNPAAGLNLFGNGAIGTLMMGGDATLLGTLKMTLSDSGLSDQLLNINNSSGDIVLGGRLVLDSVSGIDYAQTYRLFANFQPLTDSGFAISGYDMENWRAVLGADGLLSFQAVPEPSAWILLTVSVLFLIIVSNKNFAPLCLRVKNIFLWR